MEINDVRRSGEDVRVAVRLPSGDVKITFATEDAKRAAAKSNGWLRVFGDGAAIRRPAFTVLAYGVDTKTIKDLENDEAIVAELRSENKVGIVGAKRPQKQKTRDNARTTLLVSVENASDANTLCERGLILRYQVYTCQPFVPEA